jgi:hypothetical protein
MIKSLSRQHHIAGHLDRDLVCHNLEICHRCNLVSKMRFVLSWLPEKKARQLGINLPPKQTLRLVQPSFANRYLMKAILGAA